MIEWIILVVSFLSLYVGIFWLHVVSFQEDFKKNTSYYPFVSLIVPARNEEKGLWKTVHSLISLDNPKEKLEFIFFNLGYTDKTFDFANNLSFLISLLDNQEK